MPSYFYQNAILMPGCSNRNSRLLVPCLLIALFLVGFAVRVHLAVLGGQTFFPDEYRYAQSLKAAGMLLEGKSGALSSETLSTEHYGFKVLGILPAMIELGLHKSESWVPAAFFSLFSCASILLVYWFARNLRADSTESLLASFLYFVSTTATYYARHLIPYDVALCIALLSLCVLTSSRKTSFRYFTAGALASFSFFTYNGNWYLTAFVCLYAVFSELSHKAMSWRRLLLFGAGFATVIVAAMVLSEISPLYFLTRYKNFATVEHQGDYNLGWLIPFQYYWHVEHLLAVLWLLALVEAVAALVRGDGLSLRTRVSFSAICTLYTLLVVLSVVLHHYGVYGRTSRLMAPFLCVLTANALYRRLLHSSKPVLLVSALILCLLIQYGFNLVPHQRMIFLREFKEAAEADYAKEIENGSMYIVNDKFYYPCPEKTVLSAGHAVIREALHPFHYVPFLFEGFSKEMRRNCEAADLKLLLVRTLDQPSK